MIKLAIKILKNRENDTRNPGYLEKNAFKQEPYVTWRDLVVFIELVRNGRGFLRKIIRKMMISGSAATFCPSRTI